MKEEKECEQNSMQILVILSAAYWVFSGIESKECAVYLSYRWSSFHKIPIDSILLWEITFQSNIQLLTRNEKAATDNGKIVSHTSNGDDSCSLISIPKIVLIKCLRIWYCLLTKGNAVTASLLQTVAIRRLSLSDTLNSEQSLNLTTLNVW